MSDKPSGFADRLRSVWLWVKVVVLVVLITLFVILLLQNIAAQSKVVFIINSRELPTAAVVAGAFVTGVLVTLLVIFVRRGSGK